MVMTLHEAHMFIDELRPTALQIENKISRETIIMETLTTYGLCLVHRKIPPLGLF